MIRLYLLIVLLFPASLFAEVIELKLFEKRTPGGRLVESYQYYEKDGVQIQHGVSSLYYGDGSLMGSGRYHEGKIHGPWISYYKWIGKKHKQSHYKHGKFDGPFKIWTPSGELLYESTWKDGEPWNGIASKSGTSSAGFDTETVKDTTYRYENGSKVRKSKKIYTTVCKRPDSKFELPVFSEFLKWNYYQYDIESNYPYLKRLPDLEKVPELIDWCHQKKDSSDVAYSQLVTLSRVNFQDVSTKAKQKQWIDWWQKVGSTYQNMKPVKAEITSKAWDLARNKRTLSQPKAPIYLPAEYTINFHFNTGEQHPITEKITLTRTVQKATLTREYSLGLIESSLRSAKEGKTIKVIKEEWIGLSTTDVDIAAAAIAYIIDNPWLLNDEKAINKNFIKEVKSGKGVSMGAATTPKIKGRESFNLYYASSSFEMKSGDNIWWNEDPTSWGGTNASRYESAANPLQSTVYPFFVSLYPETQRAGANKSGWKTISQK